MSSPSESRTRTVTTEESHPADVAARGGVREVVVLAVPVILTQMSATAMGIVDSVFVGSLGATELAAVGFGGIWMWTTVCFLIGMVTAVQTFVSQHNGAGEKQQCGPWTWQGYWAVMPPALLATVLILQFCGPAMAALGPSAEIQPLSTGYMQARAFGLVGLLGAMALSSFFRGVGDTRTPLYATLVANGVNVVLDYGLIFGHFGLPAWGVAGAGVATAIAEWIFFLAMLVYFLRPRTVEIYHTHPVGPRWSSMRRLIRTGAPIGGQWWLEMISFAAFMTLVARMGDASMAASQAFVMLLSLSFMQAVGISIAVSTLVGQYIGAEDLPSAEKSFRSGLKLAAVLAALIALLFCAVPELLIGIFTTDAEVLRLGRPLLLVGALFQFFDAFAIIVDGALRGAGDTRWPFLVRVALAWGVFLPSAYLAGVTFGGGLTWAWVGGAFYIALLALALVWRFQSGAWQKIQI